MHIWRTDVSYGIDPRDAHRKVGLYAGRILKGAKSAEMPLKLARYSACKSNTAA
jgi:hypothetical protein